jgi:hypothetical protein
MNTVASLLTTPPPSSILSNMGSITTNPPILMSLGSMVSMPTGTVTCIDGSTVMMANECLNGLRTTANTVDITIVNMPMAADAAAAASINDLAGRVFSTAKAVSSPLLSNAQPPAIGLGNVVATTLPTANPNPLPTTATAQGNIPSNIPKHTSNAAENVFNQLMSGATTDSPVLMAPAGQLAPLPPALGIARGRRRV